MDRPLTTAYWMEAGAVKERERIIELLTPIAGKCHLCDYDVSNIADLIRGGK